MEGLDEARRSGGDRAIAYVAWGTDHWLFGWASTLGAVDLSSGRQEERPSEEIRKLLGDLDSAGNNDWHDQPGKRDARRILRQLDERVSRDFTAGAMLAHGHSVTSLNDLVGL